MKDHGNYWRSGFFILMFRTILIRIPVIRELLGRFLNILALEALEKKNKEREVHLSISKELMAYNWPGNVREQEHLIERSILMCTNNVIREMHLPRLTSEESKSFFKKTYQKSSKRMNAIILLRY